MHPELSMPRYGGPLFQDNTGRSDFANFTAEVFSPELPCGAGWLASALLELQVPLWRFWGVDIDADWHSLGARRYRYENRFSAWSRIITGLTDGREFTFRALPVPRFTHDLPGAWTASERLVAFVRDPRDALYSKWRRESARGLSDPFVTWLAQLDARWNLPRLHAYAMDIATWICFARSTGMAVLVARFEDTKVDPEAVLRRVWRFIASAEPTPTEDEFSRAVVNSQFARARGIEDRLIAERVLSDRINFRGIAYEYKHREDYARAIFEGIDNDLFVSLGYEPLSPGRARTIADPLSAPWLRDRRRCGFVERAVELAAIWVGTGARPTACSTPLV
jgi:hypothetical protein